MSSDSNNFDPNSAIGEESKLSFEGSSWTESSQNPAEEMAGRPNGHSSRSAGESFSRMNRESRSNNPTFVHMMKNTLTKFSSSSGSSVPYTAATCQHSDEETLGTERTQNSRAPLVNEQVRRQAHDHFMSERKKEARIAAARLIQRFDIRQEGIITVERSSVYGAALVMPQLARSAQWPKFLASMALRSYVFLIFNYMVQGMMLAYIQKEENVFNIFSGQMYLCDYGANLHDCDGHNDPDSCTGPGGTLITPARLYNFQTWSLRNFIKDALVVAFPDKAEQIKSNVDTGEYGLESYWCRVLCCGTFMLSCMTELTLIMELAYAMFTLPTEDDMWIETLPDEHSAYEDPSTYDESFRNLEVMGERTTTAGHHHNSGHHKHGKHFSRLDYMDHCRIKVAGMPLHWKVINIVMLLFPKALLWKITCEAGVMFLMETSGIEDSIINSVALTFILNIDELICTALMSQVTKDMLEVLEDYPLYTLDADAEHLSDEEVMRRQAAEPLVTWSDLIRLLIPWRMLLTMGLTYVFMTEYYHRNCAWDSDGERWVSKVMYLPKSTRFGFLDAFFPNFFHVDREMNPFFQHHAAAPPG